MESKQQASKQQESKTEPLAAELRECLALNENTQVVGIYHPLLTVPVYDKAQAGEINQEFRTIRKHVSAWFTRKNWLKWILAHESHYRWQSLIGAVQYHGLTGKDLAKVFRVLWLESPDWWIQAQEIGEVIESIGKLSFSCSLTDGERTKLDRLRNVNNVVYRGWSRFGDHGPHGYAWSPKRGEAERYARRGCQKGPNAERWPLVAVGLVSADHVLACYHSLGEHEYLIAPGKVRFQSIEVLEQIGEFDQPVLRGNIPETSIPETRLINEKNLFTFREAGDDLPIVAWCQVPRNASTREAQKPHIQGHRALRLALNCGIKIKRMVFARDYESAVQLNASIEGRDNPSCESRDNPSPAPQEKLPEKSLKEMGVFNQALTDKPRPPKRQVEFYQTQHSTFK